MIVLLNANDTRGYPYIIHVTKQDHNKNNNIHTLFFLMRIQLTDNKQTQTGANTIRGSGLCLSLLSELFSLKNIVNSQNVYKKPIHFEFGAPSTLNLATIIYSRIVALKYYTVIPLVL